MLMHKKLQVSPTFLLQSSSILVIIVNGTRKRTSQFFEAWTASSDFVLASADWPEGRPVSSEIGRPGRSGPRRKASAIREGRRSDGEARKGGALGGSPGGTVRENGFKGRKRGGLWDGGRRAKSRSRDGLSRGADAPATRATATLAPVTGTAAPRNGAPVPDWGVRLANPDRVALRGGATQREPSGDLCGRSGQGRRPRRSGQRIAASNLERRVLPGTGAHTRRDDMRLAFGARDRGWSFTAYSLDPEASGSVSAGHVAPTPRSRP